MTDDANDVLEHDTASADKTNFPNKNFKKPKRYTLYHHNSHEHRSLGSHPICQIEI